MCFLFFNILKKKKRKIELVNISKKNHKKLPFNIIKLLQKGKYNYIYSANHNNKKIIVKCCYRFRHEFTKELSALNKLNHDNIVKKNNIIITYFPLNEFNYITNTKYDFIHIFGLEFIKNGDLFYLLKKKIKKIKIIYQLKKIL